MNRHFGIASLFACTLVAGLALAEAAPLDGRSFAIESGEKGKPAKDKEELVFKAGRFHSLGCDAWGFADAPYHARKDGPATTFDAEIASSKEGRIVWRGRATRDAIEGSYVWTKTGQAPIEYWFKGTAKK